MASYTIPRSSTSTWIIMPSNQSTLHKSNWNLLLLFALSLIFVIIIIIIVRLFADCVPRRRRTIVARTHRANHALPVSSTRLDARAIASLPTFVYHSSDNNDGSERQCAVCLSAAKEGEMMRMLPNCKHFFHVKCIGMWLHSHPTCPICRAEVKPWRREVDGRLLASPTMPARVGGVKGEELSMARVMVNEGSEALRLARV